MRTMLLAAIAAAFLCGCSCRYPLNCPPYDPEQYGCGPRDPYCVTRSSYGFPCSTLENQPYRTVPPWAAPGNPTMPAGVGSAPPPLQNQFVQNPAGNGYPQAPPVAQLW